MGVSRVYLDSYCPVELVKEGGEASDVRSLLYKLVNNNAFDVFISQIALGEALAVICRDSRSGNSHPRDTAAKLADVMNDNGIGWERAVPPNGSAFGIMHALRKADGMLDPTDTMIVSHALADSESKFFLTTDNRLLGNREVIKLDEKLRVEGVRRTNLKIQDRV